MVEGTRRQLADLATQVAESLVLSALEHMARQTEGVTITVQPLLPAPTRRALSPAPTPKRRGRKPGPKPRKPKRASKRQAATTSRKAAPAAPAVDLSARRCRKCKKLGTATLEAGSDRSVRCTSCGFRWNLRFKADERPAPSAAVCRRCDHDVSAHVGAAGKCLVPRCSCTELYQ